MCYFDEVLGRAKDVSRKQTLFKWPGFDSLDFDVLASVGVQASAISAQVSSWLQHVTNTASGPTVPGKTVTQSLEEMFQIPKSV